MRLQALKDLSHSIKAGAIFKVPEVKAKELIGAGYAVTYCYWIDTPVSDCVYPCYSSDTKKACSHFETYWQKRLEELKNA